ncbi:MAG TPA: C4-type zinc ribbon domain-containing protein [Thermoanaerobaculia bacterium]|nr:C4-type zinc ribbon domain-containing protein [Thermoanaerobaculia bacterium]HXK66903.1 C4-type zinc ribbon domain-containing protein [Thermoanaerobaculia bacterium]
MNPDLERLVLLQKNLSRQGEVHSQIETIPPHLKDIHDAYSKMASKRDALQSSSEEAKRAQRELEAVLEDAREERKTYRKQLMQVTNQREYGAVLKEIDILDEKIKTMEDDLFTRMEVVENAQQTLEQEKEVWERLETEYREKMAQWEDEKHALKEEKIRLEDEQRGLEFELPLDLKQSFWRLMKARGKRAVVPVVDYTCRGCNVKLRPQQYAEVRAGKKICTCDGCMRFLYFDEQES